MERLLKYILLIPFIIFSLTLTTAKGSLINTVLNKKNAIVEITAFNQEVVGDKMRRDHQTGAGIVLDEDGIITLREQREPKRPLPCPAPFFLPYNCVRTSSICESRWLSL